MVIKKGLFFLFIFVFSFIYISCPREDFSGVYDVELLNYELSKEIVKVNDPVEITVRWCFGDLDADEILSIMRLENVEMILLEGEFIKSDNENALFVRFVDNASSDNASTLDVCPYCKLQLIFQKAGDYELKFIRTTEDALNSNFNDGYMYKIINVEEN